MAAALGLGLAPGDVVMSFGTSGTVYAVSDQPTADPTGAVAGFADASGGFLPLVCTLNATKVTDKIGRLIGVEHAEFDQLAMNASLGAGGLTLIPYLDGERTPNRPTATGLLSGIRSDVSREQLARAAVEGVVCGMLDGLDGLREHVRDTRRIVMVGGGSRSEAYRQVLADLCDLPVVVANAAEAVATGAAVQAAAVLRQVTPSVIAQRWNLGQCRAVGRSARSSTDQVASIRARYRQVRDLQP
jgi:xylulokinase